ncbi:hypothetical protein [Anaerolentibacter hominis]|uniref:hypothetical protein n=1 Tax=Anaerolentibacter hominis TaxID=3079009 RepID=UPI0031B8AC7F
MKRKLILAGVLLLLLIVGGLLGKKFLIGTRPFRNLSAEDIKSADVELIPPGVIIQIGQKKLPELVDILNRTVIYQEDNSYVEYDGQGVVFTIRKTDGTQVTVIAYNPFLVIDGVGYRTKYGPCQDLSSFANDLRRN